MLVECLFQLERNRGPPVAAHTNPNDNHHCRGGHSAHQSPPPTGYKWDYFATDFYDGRSRPEHRKSTDLEADSRKRVKLALTLATVGQMSGELAHFSRAELIVKECRQ